MRGHIDKQKAIDALVEFTHLEWKYLKMLYPMLEVLEQLPSAEEESFEWCDTCKEYDQEKHCCHRYSKMIRKTIEEMQIVHCCECQYSEYDSVYGDRYCHYNGKAEVVDDYHFCRDGERKTDG